MSEFKKVKRTIDIRVTVNLEARTYCKDRFGDEWAQKDADFLRKLILDNYGAHILRHVLTANTMWVSAEGKDDVEDVSPERESEIRRVTGRDKSDAD